MSRYNFTSVLSIQNYYNLSKQLIRENFIRIFEENNIENTDIQINVSYPAVSDVESFKPAPLTDCMKGRILTKNGIYACPFLSNDYRGRMGASFLDYSKNITAETDFCTVCSANQGYIFAIG